VTEALSLMHTPVARAVERPRRVAMLRCSFCRAELGENLEFTIAGKSGQGTSTGSFCSAHCRNCVLALAALHPSPLAPDEFVSRRGVLTDRLLDLWRHGQGPDPALVLRAAERVSSGLPNADSAAPTAEPSKAVLNPVRTDDSWDRSPRRSVVRSGSSQRVAWNPLAGDADRTVA
jgi:hypothetical protein